MTHRQQAMILQDDSLAITQVRGDALALLAIEHDAAELRVHGMALVEAQRVLRDHVQLASKDGESLTVHAVRVAWRRSVSRINDSMSMLSSSSSATEAWRR